MMKSESHLIIFITVINVINAINHAYSLKDCLNCRLIQNITLKESMNVLNSMDNDFKNICREYDNRSLRFV